MYYSTYVIKFTTLYGTGSPKIVSTTPKLSFESLSEQQTSQTGKETSDLLLTGSFVGVGDGIHDAQGIAKVIPIESGGDILRLEDLVVTNGPDLYVYLSTDKSASDFVNLGRLKANIGNQSYSIPAGTDITKYDTVLIWCRAFSVLFGSAELSPPAAASA